MLELAEVGNGVWDEGFGQEGLRPFELATIRLQSLSLKNTVQRNKTIPA